MTFIANSKITNGNDSCRIENKDVLNSHRQADLHFPFAAPPNPDELVEVHPGVLWGRLPLPFRLDHINVYFIDDGDGWAVIDTGIGDEPNSGSLAKAS